MTGIPLDRIYQFLFSDGGYSPHGFCIAWDLPVLYTHIGADLLIALSYFAIPAIILVFLRRRQDKRLNAPALLFALFIAACGLSHLMSIVTMYLPYYGLQGVVKLFTGVVSFVTAIALWRMLPQALEIPAPDTLMEALADREREIGERRQTQADLEISQRSLDQKIRAIEASNEELREFAYAASHDLKAPANTLSLWLQDFIEDCEPSLTADQMEALREAEKVLGRMRLLVDDILSYSRTVNDSDTRPAAVDLEKAFRDALEDLRSEVRKSRATVTIEPMPIISGFPTLVSVLVHNLLGNALKFRDPDRPLHISVSAEQVDTPISGVYVSVTDNGLGIDPVHHERIFKLFKRLHRAEDYPGTGLGLSLCRRVAVTHGGRIEVRSRVGAGATFRVFFPTEVSDVSQAA